MKKSKFEVFVGVLAVLGLVLLNALPAWSGQENPEPQAKNQAASSAQDYRMVVKSYTLRYVKPEDVLRAGRLYFEDATTYGNTIIVRMVSLQVPEFEKLLDRLDVAPKTVLLRVYPIIAIRNAGEKKPAASLDPGLKKVLDEMNRLWKFDSYVVEGPSFIPVKEAAGPDSFKLLSSMTMNLLVSDVKVTGEEAGKRTISIGELRLSGRVNFVDLVFLDTHDVTLKENGYLVAGVSGYAGSDKALVLVLNAEIE
jgi:hypothetical protein